MSLYLSAAHKSSGKTMLGIGLSRVFSDSGLTVQTFKKGPDYIDPMWLAYASRQACINLDFHTMTMAEITQTFERYARDSELSIIEGNKGLHDSVDVAGLNSNANLAKHLGTPVLLILDTRGITRGIAPLLLGTLNFDPKVNIAGVILNQVAGPRHEGKLIRAIDTYTDVRVYGALGTHAQVAITEAQLGLSPTTECNAVEEKVIEIARRIRCDVDTRALQEHATALTSINRTISPSGHRPTDLRIGVAKDQAFGFYYNDDLQNLSAGGAELIEFDALSDTDLPAVDGLFIGGGFPERHMQELTSNSALRMKIRKLIDGGLPVYAECGGLMYLAKTMSWGDKCCEMVGAIDANVVVCDRPQGRGYVRLRETEHAPWPETQATALGLPAHEFHYGSLRDLAPNTQFAYEVTRGHGIDGRHDGIVYKNVLASFSHLRDTNANHWTRRFLNFVRDCKRHRHCVTLPA